MQEKAGEVLSNDESKQEVHKAFSAACFNKCWTFIDKENRSPEETEEMILVANASLWHWKQRADCTPVNLSIGYWQVSRVYALADQYEMAKSFGDQCLKVGKENQLPPFYIGYAYEALARAEVLRKDMTKAKELLAKARTELEKVDGKDEKTLLEADLSALEKSIADN